MKGKSRLTKNVKKIIILIINKLTGVDNFFKKFFSCPNRKHSIYTHHPGQCAKETRNERWEGVSEKFATSNRQYKTDFKKRNELKANVLHINNTCH